MLVIFDMDGTLSESSTLLANSINYVRKEIGLEPLPKDIIIKEINNPDCNMPKFFYNLDKIEPIHEKLFSQYYTNNHNREQELFEGAKELLEYLKLNNINIALATNAYKKSAIETLKHLGIIDYFDEVVGFDDVKEPKPSPQMLQKILTSLNKKENETIFVGDSKRDEIAAKRANIKFIDVSKKDSNFLLEYVKPKIEEYFSIIS